MTRVFLIVAALLIVSSAVATAGDYPVPDWRLESTDGATVSFHDALDEGPVLVSFWALWCGPCLKELPHLQELAALHDGQLRVLAINVDSPRSVHKVPSFIDAKGYDSLDILLDTSGDVQRKMQTGGTMPFLALFDRNGREVYRHTGYRQGDEVELFEQVDHLLKASVHEQDNTGSGSLGAIKVANQFEYSYDTVTKKEIVENWLDATVTQGDLRFGMMLNSQQPSEEGTRGSTVRHKFVEFSTGDVEVRAGHFYGMFGRGLLFAAYEDRVIRVDTSLEGMLVRGRRGTWQGAAFTGTPSHIDVDIRGMDHSLAIHEDLTIGVTMMTWQAPDTPIRDGGLLRDWASSARLEHRLPFGNLYTEFAQRTHYVADGVGGFEEQEGHAFYGGLNIHHGGFGLSVEGKDYEDFTILNEADGIRPLNNVPTLTREHLFTLLNRHPYIQNADNARGYQAEATWAAPRGWTVLGNASQTESQQNEEIFREWYLQLEQDDVAGAHVRVGYDDRAADNLELSTVVGEVTLHVTETSSVVVKAEHQHVLDLGNEYGNKGEYNQQFFTLEYATAPHWSIAGILEVNNKYPEQRDFLEDEDPFAALQVSYVTTGGDLITVWAGKRLGGYLCAGGVCKWEPAFEGVEVYGTIRY
jgi:cytochrome c biogenesis protein CcmG, thiol:disulfide interchange protein DsbE